MWPVLGVSMFRFVNFIALSILFVGIALIFYDLIKNHRGPIIRVDCVVSKRGLVSARPSCGLVVQPVSWYLWQHVVFSFLILLLVFERLI